jgi:hypothetical protein
MSKVLRPATAAFAADMEHFGRMDILGTASPLRETPNRTLEIAKFSNFIFASIADVSPITLLEAKILKGG